MKTTHLFLAAAAAALLVSGCQPPASTDNSPISTEAPATTEAPSETTAETPAALPCGVLAQRNWDAELTSGSSPALTVSGEIDLGTPGYGVSLARDAAEAPGATTALLTLVLRSPSGMQPQVFTSHPVRYFGPAREAYASVQIDCDGATLTTINID